MRHILAALAATAIVVACCRPALCAGKVVPEVLTYHNDNSRDGQNLIEKVLTPDNVNSQTFGKLNTWQVDGYVYAQPLYVSKVMIKGRFHNVVYVATEHDSVYAFDADHYKNPKPLWQRSFLSAGVTTVPSSAVNSNDLVPEIGITSTPVIDRQTATMYVVAKTLLLGSTFQLTLHAINIRNGRERRHSPVILNASVPGSGEASSNGVISFSGKMNNQRCALTLAGGIVYIASSSHGDNQPYHGWVLGYNAKTLAQVAVFSDTPNGQQAGIWMAGGGPAADENNNLYIATGNGTFDADTDGPDYGDSFIRLGFTDGVFGPQDYFAPYNQSTLDQDDLDLGAGGVILLPEQSGVNLAVGGGKAGTLYAVNREEMGGYNDTTQNNDQIAEEIDGTLGSMFSTPAYWNGWLYYATAGESMMQFQVEGGQITPTPAFESAHTFGWPGATPSISANGSTNGIVWAIDASSYQTTGAHAVLYALNANDVSIELYDSNQAGTRDQPANGVKFSVPTIAGGKVFIGTQYAVSVYGLLP